jgi:GNAT superfamily N-acetyltransferase
MNIKPVGYAEILDAPNAQELFRAYADECSIPEIGSPNPQASMYDLLEASGAMHTFALYEADEIVGFASVLISTLPHYGQKVATLESIYVAPEHRAGASGKALMLCVEQFADVQGCAAVLYSAPTGSRLEKLLGHSPEYRQTNSVFCRRLN